ncbi:unnamed protein product [Bursaphelenchus okinawaensis]|uniref:Uncharacterized protein n=1 Tax=Bursaphelenchus okinawaensis TaxID=465554 RepID=A0A811KPK4_9BILA|nr:unnamed protein product [Bursaphelenchus okinawaensis]CAG9106938.1 unnamed protein product [Bursaphelenchus okinawaensis]
MIQIGELISKNEWESHARKLLESIPFFEEYVWKLQIPFTFAAPYLCEPCREYAPQVQTFLKNTGMASLAFDLAVCNIFFVFEKHDMVPVCDAALVGLDIYARYADPQILCSAIPSCQPSLKSVKRSASINDIAERFLRTF